MDDLPRVAVNANRVQLDSVCRARGHPDLISPNHGRRVAFVVDRRFPRDVFFFAPGERQLLTRRVTITVRAAELWPVGGDGRFEGDEQAAECNA